MFLLFSLRENAQHPPAIGPLQSRPDPPVTGCTAYGTNCHHACTTPVTAPPCEKAQPIDFAGPHSSGPTFALRFITRLPRCTPINIKAGDAHHALCTPRY